MAGIIKLVKMKRGGLLDNSTGAKVMVYQSDRRLRKLNFYVFYLKGTLSADITVLSE